MDQPTASNAARRNEDIALDLLKFVVTSTGVARSGSSAPGFVPASAAKPEDHVQQLLALYSRCLRVVEGKGDSN
uniref:Uncharacterized protein n=1 Tax=Acidobacterium capsulatum TaxID=33075 RepID=A0A7V4XUR0_9BACT